ncbi:trimeric intracellular cation channel family protein [Anaerobacillus alkaliphilus]|uniref:Trimeric intracellular cation channel family protein n=1 Tax=Anaerobacillus alkaliphilus TaxID=1548597 RepID=A0A4Q0VX35_9BACI|nr:trimeric intracellular cation channel family protein [Anaerobacillus alkaliphilus]RXJ04293.1 trimeric intracellular cation channel family protein [Anaerobacillus alkaliphilus]
MEWEILTIIGTIAFALSGVIVAMEEDYDLMGVYILGLVTAFGGGAIRNLLIGVPVSALWDQGHLFTVAIVVMTVAFFFPKLWVAQWFKWGLIFDALGLAAFAIQGALYATQMGHPISAVIVAAALTGAGGGMVRDVLAGRKPLFLRNEIYIAWAMLAGLAIGVEAVSGPISIWILFVSIVVLRMLSVYLKWQLPHRRLN